MKTQSLPNWTKKQGLTTSDLFKIRMLFLGEEFYHHCKLIFCISTSANSFSIKKKLHLFASSPFKFSLVKNLCVVFGSQKSLLFSSPFCFFLFLSFPWRLSLQQFISYHVRLEVTKLCRLTDLQLF